MGPHCNGFVGTTPVSSVFVALKSITTNQGTIRIGCNAVLLYLAVFMPSNSSGVGGCDRVLVDAGNPDCDWGAGDCYPNVDRVVGVAASAPV